MEAKVKADKNIIRIIKGSVFSILNGKSAKGQTVTIEDITNNQNAKKYYKGNVFAPYDLETFEIV